MELSLCIAGLGDFAREFVEAVHDAAEDVRFFYASRDSERARRFCETYGGAGYFGSYEDAAMDPRVDAIYFVTPHHLHLENALLAARSSKHILMDKPIARTVPEAQQMISAARAAGVKLMVAEDSRYLSTVYRCKELMADGAIGDLRLVQIQSEGYDEHTGWRTSSAMRGGGELIDGGIHDIDVLLNLGGFPERIYAAQPPKVIAGVEGEDGMVITAHLPGGALGLINLSSATAASGSRRWAKVTGSTGELRFDYSGREVILDTREGKRAVPVEDRGDTNMAILRDFQYYLLTGREPAMSAGEGLKDLAVVTAAYRSVEHGTAVRVSSP